MAISQEEVDAWFAKNKDATADDVAKAVQSVGGLEANQGLADILANRYNIDKKDVSDYYNAYTAPAKKSFVQQYLDANPDVNAEFELFKTKAPAQWTPESYAAYHYGNYGKNENRAGAEGFTGNIDTLVNQILGQNLTSKWSGEGLGSSQENAKDMANILASIGITDIKDFGEFKKTIPASSYETQQGTEYIPEQIVTTYGNKKTGQEVPNTYGERQTNNIFGGTYAGKGNTGYRVQFTPDGTPIFYTTGASSNDIVNFLGDDKILNAIAQIGASYFGGPLGSAALNAAMGKDPKDIAKSIALSYLGNEAFKGFTDTGAATNTFGETGANFAKDIKDVLGDTGSKILGKTAGQFVANEGKVDIGSLLVNQGVGAATDAVLGQIPDFKTLDPIIQKLVTKTVSNTLSGNPGLTTADLVNTALNEGLKASKGGGGSLSAEEQAQVEANREIKRLNRIEDAVLNQTASDDGTTQGILDLISEMYPSANIQGMSEGDLSKFLEANINEIQGSADLETLLKGVGQTTADDGTVTVTGDRPTGLGDFMVPTTDTPKGNVISADTPEELIITGDRPAPYISNLRTKTIKSDIPDELTPDDIDKLFPNIDFNDILQTVTPGGTKTATPTKTTVPATVTPKTTVPGTKTTEQSLSNLGLNAPMPSQDPYANIKLMEELFGGDTAYKLRALGAPKNQAFTDMDALARLLRNQNA